MTCIVWGRQGDSPTITDSTIQRAARHDKAPGLDLWYIYMCFHLTTSWGDITIILQLKPMYNLIILELQMFKYHYFGNVLYT